MDTEAAVGDRPRIRMEQVMTTTRTVEHRHTTHADLGIVARDDPSDSKALRYEDRDEVIIKLSELGMQPVFCEVTGEIVAGEYGDGYNPIQQMCIDTHWIFVSSTIFRDDPMAVDA